MHQLVPYFIAQQFAQEQLHGTFHAVTLFVDMSGFTPLTERLMQYRKDGAETLSDILNSVFNPCVTAVYQHGGFISTYAGDAFTAIFPDSQGANHAVATAFFIQQFFAENGNIHTQHGNFQVSVKIGLGHGAVVWGIVGNQGQHTYYLRGTGVDACSDAEKYAEQGEIIAHADFVKTLDDAIHTEPLENGYVRLIDHTLPKLADVRPSPTVAREGLRPFAPDNVLDMEIVAEFRAVATIFISVKESTETQAIDRFIETVLLTCNRYGGFFRHVDFGDKGMMIVLLFGAPIAHENNLERAADVLLALREQELSLRWRAGVTFGTAYAGFMGGEERRDYAAIGDVVNLSARLATKAGWDEMWVPDDVQLRLSMLGYQLRGIGAKAFKGLRNLIHVFRLDGKARETIDTTQVEKMVGRQQELNQLKAAIQPIFEGKAAGIAYIYGEAGIGKSRLMQSLRSHLAESVSWFYLPVDEVLRGSFNPLRHFLRGYFNQNAALTAAENRKRFTDVLNALLQTLEDYGDEAQSIREVLERTRSFLGALVDLHWEDSLYERAEPGLRADNTQIAFKNLILAESLKRPVILNIEDAQWLDEDTYLLIRNLTRNVETYPLALVMTSRYRDDGSLVQIDDVSLPETSIELAPFGRGEVKQLAHQLLDSDIDDTLADYLLEKTRGNPFFSEQLLLHLIDINLLAQKDGVWQATQTDLTAIPMTISAVLIARLDRLSQDVKQVVQTAAVLGQQFEVDVLSQMLKTDGQVELKVKQAEQQLIWSALSRIMYLFRHALMRDAAYEMQLTGRLRELHQLAAEAIEQLYSAEIVSHYGDLAYHYGKAANRDNERKYALLAGQEAIRKAESDALRYLSRALELTPTDDLESRYDILKAREEFYKLRGNQDPRRDDIEAMLDIAKELGDDTKHAETRLIYGEYYLEISEYDDAEMQLKKGLKLARNVDDSRLLAEGLRHQAALVAIQSDLESTIPLLEQALALYDALEDIHGRVLTMNTLATNLVRNGKFTDAEAWLNKVSELAESQGDFILRSKPSHTKGLLHYYRSEFDKAYNAFEHSYDMAKQAGDRNQMANMLVNMGGVAYQRGELDEVEKLNLQCIDIFRETGNRASEAQAFSNLSVIFLQRRQFRRALNYGEQALKLARRIESVPVESFVLHGLGFARLLIGDFERALDYLNGSLSTSIKIKNRHREVYSLAVLGIYWLYVGDADQAIQYSKQSIERAEDATGIESVGQTMSGIIHLERGELEAAKTAFTRSFEIESKSKNEHVAVEARAGLVRVALLEKDMPTVEKHIPFMQIAIEKDPLLSGVNETFQVYLSLYDALVATGDEEGAYRVLESGYATMNKLRESLEDEALQRSFIENIPPNRRLAQLWAERERA